MLLLLLIHQPKEPHSQDEDAHFRHAKDRHLIEFVGGRADELKIVGSHSRQICRQVQSRSFVQSD